MSLLLLGGILKIKLWPREREKNYHHLLKEKRTQEVNIGELKPTDCGPKLFVANGGLNAQFVVVQKIFKPTILLLKKRVDVY